MSIERGLSNGNVVYQAMEHFSYASLLNHILSGTPKGSSGTTTGTAGGSTPLVASTATLGSGKR